MNELEAIKVRAEVSPCKTPGHESCVRSDRTRLIAALEAVLELSRIRQALGYPVSPGEIQHVIGEALGG